MAAPSQYSSFKTNVGRTVTKKWKNANKISYDGDDWGDEDEYDEPIPVSAGNPRHPAWGQQPNIHPSNRSVTNPSPSQSGGQLSFDRGDDRRTFSSGAFESAYPTTQRSPFPEPQHEYDDIPFPNYNGPPPLRVDTHGQGPMPPGFRPGSRGRNFQPYEEAPFSAPGNYPPSRRSGSSNRPPPVDPYQRHDSPMRPGSRGSTASSRQFPPRKQSLTQQAPPQLDYMRPSQPANAPGPDAVEPDDNRPIPVFVRPSDIYKRMEEEKEKARQSQESLQRPSIDSTTGQIRSESVDTPPPLPDSKAYTTTVAQVPVEEIDNTRRLKPNTLDTVPERKSEYGFDNVVGQADKSASPETDLTNDSKQPEETPTVGVTRQPTDASSVSNYTDRPDPISASTISRNVSVGERAFEHNPPDLGRPTFDLPTINRMSGFGMDLDPDGGDSQGAASGQLEPAKGTRIQSSNASQSLDPHSLHHQTSLGYRSMVQQAFEQSERQPEFSPASASNTIDRSNSDATSDISPIITHHQAQHLPTNNLQTNAPSVAEGAHGHSRQTSEATIKAYEPRSPDSDFSSAKPVRTGYRRDITPPSRDNSPARRPLSVEHSTPIQPQQGFVERTRGNDASDDTAENSSTEKQLPEPPAGQDNITDIDIPNAERTTSDEWQEWQAHKKQFNQQAGFPDSGTATPYAPSPLQRSETPAKGTVRDLAGKLETQSGRSTPSNAGSQVTSPVIEQIRPPVQSRNESFRPAIPGGWQSFSSTTGAGPSAHGAAAGSSEDPISCSAPPFAPPRLDSTDSVPTARAPAHGSDEDGGIKGKAFAAAASAGTALANSLAGHRLSERTQDSEVPSEESSENEWDNSSTDSKAESKIGDNSLGAEIDQSQNQDTPKATRLPADKPSSSSDPSKGEDLSDAEPMEPEDDYVPAPLRTSRNFSDSSNPRPKVPGVLLHQESPTAADNERLEEEIEKSLTPKSSTYYGEVTGQDNGLGAMKPASSDPTPIERALEPTTTAPHGSQALAEIESSLADPATTVGQSSAGRQSPALSPPTAQAMKTGFPRPVSPSQQTMDHHSQQDPRMPSEQLSGQINESRLEQPAQNIQPDFDGSKSQSLLSDRLSQQTESGTTPPSGPHTEPQDQGRPESQTVPDSQFAPPQQSNDVVHNVQRDPVRESGSQALQSDMFDRILSQPTVQGSSEPRPFLKQRFSWETGSEETPTAVTPKQAATTPSTTSPDTIRTEMPPPSGPAGTSWRGSIEDADPGLKTAALQDSNNTVQPPQPMEASTLQSPIHSPPNRSTPSEPFNARPAQTDLSAKAPGPEPASLRDIMSLDSPQARIKAYSETRAAYASSDGQLENWLLSMQNPEHAEIFAMNGLVSQDASEATPYKPSPRRILTDSAGARQMQEDGKRLMLKAGKFGGKAGTAAKGLFAKGKEKMRHVSHGEKGPTSSSERRKSTGPMSSLSVVESEAAGESRVSVQKNSASVEAPPQIPLTISSPASPSDWFSGPILASASIDQAVPASPTSPAISAMDSDQRENEPENESGPSRSISQVTRPTTEHSPVETHHHHRSIANQLVNESHTTSMNDEPPVTGLAPPRPVAGLAHGLTQSGDASLHVPEDKRRSIVSAISSASPATGSVASQAHSRASVSPADAEEVSDTEYTKKQPGDQLQASALPDSDLLPTRPPLTDQPESPRNDTPPPGIDEPYVPLNMDVDAEAIRRAQAGEEKPEMTPEQENDRERDVSARPTQHHRPFSFSGLEDIYEGHHSPPSRPSAPMSPVSQTFSNTSLNKEMSQVSVDEVVDQATAVTGQRQSRSYSRPFGVDPNEDQLEEPMDRVRMYSSESPLPSARRPQEEMDRLRQQREMYQHEHGQPVSTEIEQGGDGEFRIAGPYIQEYRSPKPVTAPRIGRSPVQVEASGQQMPGARVSTHLGQQNSYRVQPGQQHQQPNRLSVVGAIDDHRRSYDQDNQHQHQHGYEYEYEPGPTSDLPYDMGPGSEHGDHSQYEQAQEPPPSQPPNQQSMYAQAQRQSMPPPPVPTPQENRTPQPASGKKGMFGSIFGGKGRNKLQKTDRSESRADERDRHAQKREKRGSLFRRNSRHDSISSKRSSQYGEHDQFSHLTQVPSHPSAGKRLSRDMLTTPEPKEPNQASESGKKKRFSGFGGRIFKTGGTKDSSRANSAPVDSTTWTRLSNQNLEQQIRAQTFISPQAYSQYPSSAGAQGYSYDEDPAAQFQYPSTSTYPGPGDYQHQQQRFPAAYERDTASPPRQPYGGRPTNYDSSLPGTPAHQGLYDRERERERPSPLRIDTSGTPNQGGHRYSSGVNVAHTAPAQTFPPRDSSFSPAPRPGHAGSTSAGAGAKSRGGAISPPTVGVARTTSPAFGGASASTSASPSASRPRDGRAHVMDLHKRSRSPRLGRRPSDENVDSERRAQSGAIVDNRGSASMGLVDRLGTFSSKRISPVGGVPRDESEQERPFNITVPGLDEEQQQQQQQEQEQKRSRPDLTSTLRERVEGGGGGARSETPISIESGSNVRTSTPASGNGLERGVSLMESDKNKETGSSTKDRSGGGVIAELPGSQAEGYESDEEVLMSATAYPGQEWVPVIVGDGRWDD
ncbi:hypothetical protein H2204_009892 [Knufia peltigerae]|uniref:Uncharacterized protein n=1 Tax=Knufia peltigerae TaxID=1002370 RepID=A0AA38XYC0_9EURO|nr:hypothetical protein H2204_009892 [Knufia peltigerae]